MPSNNAVIEPRPQNEPWMSDGRGQVHGDLYDLHILYDTHKLYAGAKGQYQYPQKSISTGDIRPSNLDARTV